MKVLAVRSIPLSKETRDAWKSQNLTFVKRTRSLISVYELVRKNGYDAVVNLGNSEMPDLAGVPLCNPSSTVKNLVSPAAVRRSELGQLLPPVAKPDEACWVKGTGRHGANKRFYSDGIGADTIRRHLRSKRVDVQRHVVGDEFRVITVGARVVQVSKRSDDRSDPSVREYEWVGLKNAAKGVKNIARYAATCLPDDLSLVGWDVIFTEAGEAFVLEGNTCPGMNEATVGRVWKELLVQLGFSEPPVLRKRGEAEQIERLRTHLQTLVPANEGTALNAGHWEINAANIPTAIEANDVLEDRVYWNR